jgi:hypothetical protein
MFKYPSLLEDRFYWKDQSFYGSPYLQLNDGKRGSIDKAKEKLNYIE